MLTGAGRPIGPPVTTVTFAVASGINVVALAWITVEPKVKAVTGTFTVVAPAAKVTVAGVVATTVLLELVFTVRPVGGAAAERVSVRFWVLSPVMVTVDGVKLTVAFTWTEVVPVA
jgi:hypothetical protein